MTTPQDPNAPQPGYPPSYPPAGSGYPPPGPPGYPPQGPMGYAPPPPPPKRKTNWLRIAVLIAVVAVIGGGFWIFRDRLSGDVNDLAVGDCIDEPADTSSITDVQHQPCNSAHDGEVYLLVIDPSSGEYPGRDHFRDIAIAQCLPAVATYIGVADFNTRTDIDAGYFYPITESWSKGDREVTCYLYRIDGAKLTISVRGLGASPLP